MVNIVCYVVLRNRVVRRTGEVNTTTAVVATVARYEVTRKSVVCRTPEQQTVQIVCDSVVHYSGTIRIEEKEPLSVCFQRLTFNRHIGAVY